MATKKTIAAKGGKTKKENKSKFNVYQMIADKIIEQMAKGIIPWQRPWTGVADGAVNYVTRKPYSLLNQMLLGKPGEYLSHKQVEELGGTVKKGAKSSIVTFYKQIVVAGKDGETATTPDETDKERLIPLLRFYHVFHIDDCEGIETKIKPDAEPVEHEPVKEAEDIISGYLKAEPSLKFHNDKPSNRAYFSPTTDEVVVPMMSQYSDVEEYYSTTFHELTHSTLMPSRCDRKAEQAGPMSFGSPEYSREELVAEMGAAMLVNQCGMESDKAFKNSVAYVQGWSSKLKDDPKAIVWAASRAEKAARYIQGEREERSAEIKNEKLTMKNDKPAKRKTKAAKTAERKPLPDKPAIHALTYDTYENARGKTVARIAGFDPQDERLKNAADYHASATWRRNAQGEKEYMLLFSPSYIATAEKCFAEWTEKGGKSKSSKVLALRGCSGEQSSEQGVQEPAEPRYTMEEVGAMMQRVLSGEQCEELAKVREMLGIAA